MRDADYTEAVEFLSAFFRGTSEAVELRALPAPKVEFTRNPLRVIAFCQHYDGLGRGIFFGVATREEAGRGGSREFLRELPAFGVDIDLEKFGMPVEEATGILLGCQLPPSVIVFSGYGLHVYWLLASPLSVTYAPFGEDAEKTRVELVTRGLARIFHGDTNACDITRVLRLPGTHNTKEGDLKPCRVLEASWTRYELEQVETFAALSPVLIKPEATDPVPNNPPNKGDAPADDPYAAYGTNWREPFDLGRLDRMVWKDPDFPIHENRLRAIAKLVEQGVPDEEVFALALAATQRAVAEAPDTPENIRERARWDWKAEEATIRKEIRGAHALPPLSRKLAAEPEPPGRVIQLRPGQQKQEEDDPLPVKASANRPIIFVKAGELSVTADQAEQILVAAGVAFYDRVGRLMRPVVREATASNDHVTKVARLTEVTTTFMVDTLSCLIEWRKYDKRAKAWLRCDPPKEIAATLLDRAGNWAFPQVLAVVTAPTLRPDGTVVLEEGYDPATQLVLLAPPPMPVMPMRPTRSDGEAALAVLNGLLDEFCFVDDASRAVGMSALISPIVRGALLTVPAHVIRAPTAGTGKTYLVEVAAAISTGRRCQALAVPPSDEEFEKRIGAVLIGGQAMVAFDNLNGELRGNALCHMVERPLVQIRPLGFSQTIDIEQRVCVFATGNNITIVGDLVRRSLLGSLDAKVERPELKQYEKRPFDAVLADRGKYIAAALTIVRSYQHAGFPGLLPELASFADWSRFVRSALVWLGMADPVETIEKSRENDPDLAALNDVVEAWYDAGKGLNVARSAAELIGRDELHDVLAPVATGSKGALDAGKLGRWLALQKDKTVGEVRITSSGKGGHHGKKWTLVTAKVENEA